MNMRALIVVLGLLLNACGDPPPPAQPAVQTPAAIVLTPSPEQAEAPLSQPPKAVNKSRPGPSVAIQPAPAIDLRLPPQLVDELRFGEPPAQEQRASLLPPLFVEKPKPDQRFKLDGSLFTNENLREGVPTLKSIDGAELELEYKY